MKLAEIENEALLLPDEERASLAVRLLETLPALDLAVSDDEVDQRERELDSGQVTAITHDEFVRRVERARN